MNCGETDECLHFYVTVQHDNVTGEYTKTYQAMHAWRKYVSVDIRTLFNDDTKQVITETERHDGFYVNVANGWAHYKWCDLSLSVCRAELVEGYQTTNKAI